MAQHPEKLRWREELHFGLSASEFGKALGFCGRVVDYVNYRRTVVGTENEFVGNVATFHGIRTEPKSRTLYEMLTGNKVHDGGFFTMPDRVLACSPDGQVFYRDINEESTNNCIITTEEEEEEEQYECEEIQCTRRSERRLRLLEIKSPFHALYGARREENKPFGIPLHYMCQIQGQMAIANANECDFFIYLDSNEYCAVEAWRVYRSNEFWAWAEPKLRTVAQWIENGLPIHTPRHFNFTPFDFASLEVTPLVFPYNLTEQRPMYDSIEFAFFERFANPYNCSTPNKMNDTVSMNETTGNCITSYKYKNEVIDIVKSLQSPVVHFLFGKCNVQRETGECGTHTMSTKVEQNTSKQHFESCYINMKKEEKLSPEVITNENNKNQHICKYKNNKLENKGNNVNELERERWARSVDYCVCKICAYAESSVHEFIQKLENVTSCKKRICDICNHIAFASDVDNSVSLSSKNAQMSNVDVIVFRPFEWDSGEIYMQLVFENDLLCEQKERRANYRVRAFHRSVFISLNMNNYSIKLNNGKDNIHSLQSSSATCVSQHINYDVLFPLEMLFDEEEEEQHTEEQLEQISEELICEYRGQENEEEWEEKQILSCAVAKHEHYVSTGMLTKSTNDSEHEEPVKETNHMFEIVKSFQEESTANHQKKLFPLSACLSSLSSSSSSPCSSAMSTETSLSLAQTFEPETLLASHVHSTIQSVKKVEEKCNNMEEPCIESTLLESIHEYKNGDIHSSCALTEQTSIEPKVTDKPTDELQQRQSTLEESEAPELEKKWILFNELLELLHCSTNCNEVVIIRNVHSPVQYYPCGAYACIVDSDNDVNVWDDLDNDTDSDVEEIIMVNTNNNKKKNNNDEDKEAYTLLIAPSHILLFICTKLSEHAPVNSSISPINNLLNSFEEDMHLSIRMYAETVARSLRSRQGKSKLWQRAHNINNLLVCCVPECCIGVDNKNNTIDGSTNDIAIDNKHLLVLRNIAITFSSHEVPCVFLNTTDHNDNTCIFDKIAQMWRCQNINKYQLQESLVNP